MNNYLQFGTVIGVYNYPHKTVIEDLVNDVRKGHHLKHFQLPEADLTGNWDHWQLFNGADSDGTSCKFLVTDETQIQTTQQYVSSNRINYLHSQAEERTIEYPA
jgi:hypothetical protein